MYQAFPHQKFGAADARIVSVSRTVLSGDELSIPGLKTGEPVFRVRAALAQSIVRAYGEAIPIRPGMVLTADVIIDERTLLEWLLDPLYAAGRR
jgi:membrane fusion protein